MIEATVIRSGNHHPYENLTPSLRRLIAKRLDTFPLNMVIYAMQTLYFQTLYFDGEES